MLGAWSWRSYVAYFYDGVNGKNVDLAGADGVEGARLHMDSLTSHRVRLGTQLSYPMSTHTHLMAGLGVEQTFGAKAEGTITDSVGELALQSDDVNGTTGFMTLGAQSSLANGRFVFGGDLTAYTGKRSGVAGSVRARWHF